MEAWREALTVCVLLEVLLAEECFPLMRWLVLNEAFSVASLEVFLAHRCDHFAGHY